MTIEKREFFEELCQSLNIEPQVTEEHFARVAQNPTQSVRANGCEGEKRKSEPQQFSLSDKQCQQQSKQKVVTVGLEPTAFCV